MKFDNKTFQQKYEAWKNGADYWKDIRGINLGGDTQAEEPSPEEQEKMDADVQSILNEYNSGKDIPVYKGGKSNYVDSFVSRIAPLVGQQLNRYGYKNDATFYNIMRQLAWESNYGRSRVARQQHNYGGVGWNGKTYTTYKDDADFVENYVRLMHNRYDNALRAKTTQDYARALKQKGYYGDSLQNYTNGLIGMKSVVRASAAHRLNNRDKYNYNVKLDDVIQDYEDAKNASPIIINSPSTKQPATINAAIPTTLLGPTEEQIKAEQYNKIRQQVFDQLTSPIPMPPAMQKMLQGNNRGKDSFGQKFWQRRGNNLHFKGGKDERIAGVNPIKGDQQEINFLKEYNPNVNQYYHIKDNNGYHTFYDAGQLDDVIVKPSYFDKRLLNLSKKTFPNKGVRNAVYNTTSQLINDNDSNISFNDAMLNQVKLYLKSGAPGIVLSNNITRDFYTPYLNNLNLNKSNPGYIDELSHAFQYKHTNHPVFSTGVISEKVYGTPGSIEHLAHGTIQPHLVDFIKTGNEKHLNKAKQEANKEYSKYGHWWWNKGKDKRSFSDWANKASVYKGIKIKDDPTYDYKSWYNEDLNRAYALLNDDPHAHFDDKWKTPYHPTFSDQSVYSNAKHPGGTWGRFDYRDAYYAPLFSYVNPNDRISYLNMAEDNGVVPFMNNGSMYRLDGDLYGGVLPAVQVIGKRGKK